MQHTDCGDDRPRGRPLNAEVSPAIVSAVLSLLAQQGYAKLTTAAVAKRAGVSTATLYRRWPSKRELLLGAAAQIANSEEEDADTGSTSGDLDWMLNQKRRVLADQVGAALVALVGESAHDAELAEVVRASIFEPTRAHLDAILRRAAARGEQLDVSADAAANLVVGALLGRAAFGAAGGSALSDDDVLLLSRAIAGPTDR